MKKGTVYILTNPCLDGWIKIGCTEKNDIQERLNSLNASTSIPLSFRVYAILNVENSKETEQRIHKLLDIINPSLHSIENLENGKVRVREFFQISPEKAYMIFKEVAAMMGISDNLKLKEPTKEEQEEENIIKDTRQRTTFKNLQIPVGSELVLFKDESIKCTTVDDTNKVSYNGEITTLSAIGRELLGYNVSAPKIFLYNGEILWDRRLRIESETSTTTD